MLCIYTEINLAFLVQFRVLFLSYIYKNVKAINVWNYNQFKTNRKLTSGRMVYFLDTFEWSFNEMVF